MWPYYMGSTAGKTVVESECFINSVISLRNIANLPFSFKQIWSRCAGKKWQTLSLRVRCESNDRAAKVWIHWNTIHTRIQSPNAVYFVGVFIWTEHKDVESRWCFSMVTQKSSSITTWTMVTLHMTVWIWFLAWISSRALSTATLTLLENSLSFLHNEKHM